MRVIRPQWTGNEGSAEIAWGGGRGRRRSGKPATGEYDDGKAGLVGCHPGDAGVRDDQMRRWIERLEPGERADVIALGRWLPRPLRGACRAFQAVPGADHQGNLRRRSGHEALRDQCAHNEGKEESGQPSPAQIH